MLNVDGGLSIAGAATFGSWGWGSVCFVGRGWVLLLGGLHIKTERCDHGTIAFN